MKKNVIHKILLTSISTLIMILTVVVFFNVINHPVSGFSYEDSSSWDGSNLPVTPLTTIEYNSIYTPFSIISSPGSTINESLTYVIESAADLYHLSMRTYDANREVYLRLDYVLGKDIDYNDAAVLGNLFRPIGYEALYPFIGSFDGQGFEISNLFFAPISTDSEYIMIYGNALEYYAMFSRVGLGGIVENVGVINPIMAQPIDWGVMRYAASLVGENQGTVRYVYMVDSRSDAGLAIDGLFHISGLLSVNLGTFTDAYVATRRVKSLAVSSNLSETPVTYQNTGTLERVYFDDEAYFSPTGPTTIGTPLMTIDMQSSTYFPYPWFLNRSYSETNPQAFLFNSYPILKGLEVGTDGKLEIQTAADLVYFRELLTISGYFRTQEYVLVHDLDMKSVSETGYLAPVVGFGGVFSSRMITDSENTTLYTRSGLRGASGFYSIINLNIIAGAEIGNFASYGLFGLLTGTVSNLNIVNAIVHGNDAELHVAKTKIAMGIVAGNMSNGTLINVHVLGDILIPEGKAIGRVYMGGLVGDGTGTIERSTTAGTLAANRHPYHANSDFSSVGGLVGLSNGFTIEKSVNTMTLSGLSFAASNTSTLYLGGIIGRGTIRDLFEVKNEGAISAYDDNGFVQNLYLGGIIGYQNGLTGIVQRTNNQGNIDVLIKNVMFLRQAGYGTIENLDGSLFYSLTNGGTLTRRYVGGTNSFSVAQIEQMNIGLAGVVVSYGSNATFRGLFNTADINLDLSLIHSYAGTIIANNSYQLIGGLPVYDNQSSLYGTSTTIAQAYNDGNITAISQTTVPFYQIKLSGNVLGKNVDVDHLRNTGNISVHFAHATDKLFASAPAADGLATPYKNLKVVGLLEEVSQGRFASNLYNVGNLSVTMATGLDVRFNVLVSGIGYKNANSDLFTLYGIDPASVDLTKEHGSVHNSLNDGNLYASGEFFGQMILSGIITINQSLITSAFNTGHIFNRNATKAIGEALPWVGFDVASAGISYLMEGRYAQILDSANYGTVSSLATTTSGFVSASGIAVRNERTENHATSGYQSDSYLAKIAFTVNYGNIYVWNPNVETAYTIANETRSKASAVLTQGFLSTINVINYGNVYSRYLASGLYGFIDFGAFAMIQENQVFIANSINYGKVRQLTGAFTYNAATNEPTGLSINQNYVAKSQTYSGFGALIGKVHTGTTEWEFSSFVGDGQTQYSLDFINFSYLVNFDSVIDIVGNSPNAMQANKERRGGATVVQKVNRYMASTKINDASIYPFNYIKCYTFNDAPLTGSQGITNGDTYSGIFNITFTLRTPALQYVYLTDQYVADYIQFIPTSKANPALLTKIGFPLSGDATGIYALSSSRGISNGIFIPDNADFDGFNPKILTETGDVEMDEAWQNVTYTGGSSVYYKFNTGMKQLDKSIATTIFDLQLRKVGDPGVVIRNPVIDPGKSTITFYVASNSDAANDGGTSSPQQAYRYVEAGQGIGASQWIPYAFGNPGGLWIGNYQKQGSSYVSVGPYSLAGTRNVNFNTTLSEAHPVQLTPAVYDRYDAVSPTSSIYYIHQYIPHVAQAKADGYTVQSVSAAQPAGYGAYRVITTPTTHYEYVGPYLGSQTYAVTPIETVQLYPQHSFAYEVDLNPDSYQLADKASFYYENNGQQYLYENNATAAVPRGYGKYGTVYGTNDQIIDDQSSHYGTLRVYSEAYIYDPLNPDGDTYTYKDYEVRIIRVPDEELTSLDTLYVNGVDAKPMSIPDYKNVTATQGAHYKLTGDLGKIAFSYSTYNIADEANLLEQIRLVNSSLQVVDPSLYTISGGIVQTVGAFNNATGIWGAGSVAVDFEVSELLPSGNYTIEVVISSSDIYRINFTKIQSSEVSIRSFTYDAEVYAFDVTDNTLLSSIPYGLYYRVEDPVTHKVNFTNLLSLLNIEYDQFSGINIPSYLSSFEISPYASLDWIDFSIIPVDSYRRAYAIVFHLSAEDGTPFVFTHTLTEMEVSLDVLYTYKNGAPYEEEPITFLTIERERAATIRVDFDWDAVYFAQNNLNVTVGYMGDNLLGAIENQDYYISLFPGVGYEISFIQTAPMGEYTIDVGYSSNATLVTGNYLEWSLNFEDVFIEKLKNSNSKLHNVTFVADTIFSGFNTIIDYAAMDSVAYGGYLEFPETRTINALPTSGINYGLYDQENAYWIIGQVQRTNLFYYSPIFTLVIGAQIKRIIDPANAAYPEMQTDELFADFNPALDESTFNYVHYRVYSEDYDAIDLEFSSNYTDYFVAVQDVTNNVRFQTSVFIDDTIVAIPFDKVFITFLLYQDSAFASSMSLFSHFYQTNYQGENLEFVSNSSGMYRVIVDLPEEYTFTIEFPNQFVDVTGDWFFIEDSIISRRYSVKITISLAVNPDIPWGENEVIQYEP